jgi:hypothetical protein
MSGCWVSGDRSQRSVRSASCGAAHVAKPKARLCEPWGNHAQKISGARKAGDIAAPRLQQIIIVTQGSQGLALGLGTTAASQLVE